MKKITLVLFLFISKISLTQGHEDYRNFMDTVLSEIKLVQVINKDSIFSLMIFSQVYETGGGIAKGFLVTHTIPLGTTGQTFPIGNCPDSCDIRVEVYPYPDSLFIINYKWRESKNFLADTCYIFRHQNSYMAYSKRTFTHASLKLTQSIWYNGPKFKSWGFKYILDDQ